MRYVLDTTALFHAREFPADFEIIISQGVIDELNRWGLAEWIQMLMETRIALHAPSDSSLTRVKSAALETGDFDRLSPTDMDVLALALELDAPLISDDYSIQNVSDIIGIRYISLEETGIRRIYYWKFKCVGCGKVFDRRIRECDVCGHELRPFRYRSEKKADRRDQKR